jgi:hypothetical protein
LPDRAKRNQSRWRCVFDANFSLGALGVLAVNDMTPELGLIEGFYGRPWPAADRAAAVTALAPHGYRFYLHAPKADALLRRRWRELHPDAEALALADFAAHCRARSVRFGIGLSPYELYREFDAGGREALAAKLAHLDQIGVNDLAILFDDMRGDLPDLAKNQAEIVAFAAERTRATRIIVCPSYYSDDPVLDRVFGQRPADYLSELGRRLDPAIHLMWTGDEVCSRELSPGALERVAEQLGRKPFLWDNYPVNDGPRMSQHLHLRAFSGRPASLAGHVAAHGINVAVQPWLTLAPAISLAMSYAEGERYSYGEAFLRAATEAYGEPLARRLQADLLTLHDSGLDRLSAERRASLRERYAAFGHPAADEVVAWLDDAFAITMDEVHTS